MRIQCDVCGKEALVFCTADEAALCQKCDDRVHGANKLASKHPRFSLLNPQIKESQLCDICQQRRALLFCQEDRALLCRECDIPIHKANEHTKKHNKFLLTGIKLSTAASYQTTQSSSQSLSEIETQNSVINESNPRPSLTENYSESSSNPWRDSQSNQSGNQQGSNSTSTISEYLMETLPGWHVEDLLDPSDDYGFCKINEQKPILMKEERQNHVYTSCLPTQNPDKEGVPSKVSHQPINITENSCGKSPVQSFHNFFHFPFFSIIFWFPFLFFCPSFFLHQPLSA